MRWDTAIHIQAETTWNDDPGIQRDLGNQFILVSAMHIFLKTWEPIVWWF